MCCCCFPPVLSIRDIIFVDCFFQYRFYGYLQNDDSVLFVSFLCLLYFFIGPFLSLAISGTALVDSMLKDSLVQCLISYNCK